MNCAIVVLLLALSLFGAESRPGDFPARRLTELNRRAVCRAGTKIKIRVTDVGRCDAFAESDCEAFVSIYQETKVILAKWEADGICQKNSISVAASSLATVLAKVFVKAFAAVWCSTEAGKACGYAISDGKAQGGAIAQTIVQAFADADPDQQDYRAFCQADVEAIADIYTEVSDNARALACTFGKGFDADVEAGYKRSMECALANAFARAAAGFCNKKGGDYVKAFEQETAWSKCTGTGEVLKWTCD